jgi:hypothetical protein
MVKSIKDYWSSISGEVGTHMDPHWTDLRYHFGKIVTRKDFNKLNESAFGVRTPLTDSEDAWDREYPASSVGLLENIPGYISSIVNQYYLEISRQKVQELLRHKRN